LLARLNKPEGSKNGPGFAFQRDLRLPKLLISEHFFKNYLDSSRGQVGRQSDKGQSGSLSSKSSIKFRGVYGYDLNPEAGIFRLSDPWKDLIWASSDWSLFVAKIGELTSAQLWIATNPPYGVRLKALPEKEFIQKCLELNPNRVAWIAEQGYSLKVLSQWPKEGWEAKKIRVLNQGLPCFICVMSALGR
jgi:hypothetical protein